MNTAPVTLEGQFVRLEPLSMAHKDQLWEAAQDESIWRWMLLVMRSPEDAQAYIETALKAQAEGRQLPFATIDKTAGKVIGSTRYDYLDAAHRSLEIGHTWINPHWQRTAINTEAKYLMLRHAFEVLNCIRVQLKTDSLNEKSRNAILRIGAKQEGILRNHMIIPYNGRVRHSIIFSILDSEWPTVKADLEQKLARQPSAK